eukprot:SAG22_NODE_73_length_22318_cov_47.105315_2_plen_71_part_00
MIVAGNSSHGYGNGMVKHNGNDRQAVSAAYVNITAAIAAVLIPGGGLSGSIYTQVGQRSFLSKVSPGAFS